MKKIVCSLLWIFFVVMSYGQAPGILNYQGVARNSVGNVLVNKAITLRLTIHDGSATGTIAYQETRSVTTNPFGLFNVQIGSPGANNTIGTVLAVNWPIGSKFLQVEIDLNGGSSFINLGTVQLASVPYALNAATANPIGPAGGSLTGNYPNPIIANGAIIQQMVAPGVTLPPSGPAGGDLGGNYPNPSVFRLRGVNISSTPPLVNNIFGYDGTNWGPVNLATHPDNYWRLNGNDIYKSNTGNVGIGTSTPLTNLHIKSNLGVSLMLQGTESSIQFNKANGDLSGRIYNNGSDMLIHQYGGRITFGTGLFDRLTISPEGNVGIGTPAPHASSKLEMNSTNSGLLIPRMTEAQRNAISGPATSLVIYQTDNTPGFYFFDGSIWTKLATGGTVTNLWSANGNHIYNNNSGNVGIGTSSPFVNLHIKADAGGLAVVDIQGESLGIRFRATAGFTRAYIENNDNDLALGSRGDINFNNSTSASTYMHIHNNGNVGIGTTTPAYKLTVESSGPGIVQTDGGRRFGTSSTVPTGSSTMLGGFFGTYSNDALGFFTNNLLKMTILQGGNVGIGTNNPSAKLHINSNDEALRLSGNDSYMTFYDVGSYKGFVGAYDNDIELGTPNTNLTGNIVIYQKGAPQFTMFNNGRFRAGPLACTLPLSGNTNQPPVFSIMGSLGIKRADGDNIGEWAISYSGNKLYFWYNGNDKAYVKDDDGDWISLSDRRLKENFQSYKPVLDGIKKLEVYTYHYKADQTGKISFGLVAQNLQEYFPELVSTGGVDGKLGISYGKTGVLAIKAIQEQQIMIDELKKENAEIRQQLKTLIESLSKK